MSAHASRTGIDASPTPPVFVRAIQTPPALPWVQRRIAALDAQRSAPVAYRGLTLRLKRLRPWKFKRHGSFAAVYVRTEDVGAGFVVDSTLNHFSFQVRFEPRTAKRSRHLQTGLFMIAATTAALSVGWAAVTILDRRASASARLGDIEAGLDGDLRRLRGEIERRRYSVALEGLDQRGATAADILRDMANVSQALGPDIPIEGYHWRVDGVGVEVRGDSQPFPEGWTRSARTLRPGVWLWVRQPAPAPERTR